VQFARLSGFERIITTANVGRHGEMLRGLGATDVLDRASVDAEGIARALGGVGVGVRVRCHFYC
jgi:hypothetical protein